MRVPLNRMISVYTLFIAIFIVGYVLFPPFRNWSNVSSLLGSAAPLIMVAVAQLFAMLVWGIDLSVGSIMNVIVVVASFVLAGPAYQVVLGIAACILLGALLGLTNGLFITRLKLPDFVVTMATFISYQGIALCIRPTPGGSVNQAVLMFTYETTLGIPNPVWLLLILLLILGYVLHGTRFGHYMIAVGSNRESSYLLGLPVQRIRVAAYTMSGVCAAIAGLFLMGMIGTGAPNAADSYQLDSIIATVVGGTSLYGGHGSIPGTVFGALILLVALKMLTYSNLLGSYVMVFEGAMVVLVVALVSSTNYYRRRRPGTRQAATT